MWKLWDTNYSTGDSQNRAAVIHKRLLRKLILLLVVTKKAAVIQVTTYRGY